MRPADSGRTRQCRLDNGLQVVVVERREVPVVAVHVMYGVGSRHERAGEHGVAHLFEHLACQGEHMREVLVRGGTADAATSVDHTMFFAAVPASVWELAAWLEADRMAGLGEALSQQRLDTQRSVVAQERYQRIDSAPYGDLFERATGLVYPPGHPYHHLVIGSMADVQAVTLADARAFFAAHYGPGNAVVAIVGDVDAEHALSRLDRYFGSIPDRGCSAAPAPGFLDPLGEPVREDIEVAAAPFAVVALAYRLPANSVTSSDIYACDLALRILASGTSSRAHRRLVDHDRSASHVEAVVYPRLGPSYGQLAAMAAPGVEAAVVEKALLEEIGLLAEHGPTDEELARCQAETVRECLAATSTCQRQALQSAFFTAVFGDTRLAATLPQRYAALTAAQVRAAAAEWLHNHQATIAYHPTEPTEPASTSSTDRN